MGRTTATTGREGGGFGSDTRSGDDMCGVSGALAEFAADFEAKILQPAREKRATSDPILAIRPVALGVSVGGILVEPKLPICCCWCAEL